MSYFCFPPEPKENDTVFKQCPVDSVLVLFLEFSEQSMEVDTVAQATAALSQMYAYFAW